MSIPMSDNKEEIKSIDLRKENEVVHQQIVVDELVFTTKQPLPEHKAEIQIKIAIECKFGKDIQYMEDFKLELMNEINDAIRNADSEDKLKIKTQIITR